MADISNLLITRDQSIRDAIICIDRNQGGIALVVDEEQRLVGTISDGDIRRAMLAHLDLGESVTSILESKKSSPYPTPVTAAVGTPADTLIQLMRDRVIQSVPLLDQDGRVAGVVMLDKLLPMASAPMRAIVMAGGFGTRLRPLTNEVPKAMLKVRGRPLLELIVGQLEQAGIRHVNVSTHYKAGTILEHFGDGRAFGVKLEYINEDQPLGTAGALGLIERPSDRLLVVNGDILTDLDYRAMLAFHVEHQADLTMAVRRYDLEVPYGVVECKGATVTKITEKPSLNVLVNAGIYLLEPRVYDHIALGQPLNMTELIDRLLRAGLSVVSFPLREYWIDIGQPADYLRAQQDADAAADAVETQP